MRRQTLRRAIFIGLVVATVVVVALVALVASGVLVVSPKSTPDVTIQSVRLFVVQGNTQAGNPWLEPGTVNYSTNGYPKSVAPGATWSVAWAFTNFDTQSHSVYKVIPTSVPETSAGTNFTIAGYYNKYDNPITLPYTIPAAEDGTLSIFLIAPDDPGQSFVLTLTVQAETIS